MGVGHAGGLTQYAADNFDTWVNTKPAAECI